jgi:S1-C subfamily serine protease
MDQTLTMGIISGLGREIESLTGRPIKDVIQTDAAINPGNSGGPLLDSAGRLIGVNTAIYSPSGAFAGIGFAVPVDTVRRIVPQILRSGRAERAGLGIRIADDSLAVRLGVTGVLVVDVPEGSAGAKAGLRPTQVDEEGSFRLGDIIVAVNDQEVRKSNDLYSILDELEAGDEVTLTVERDDRRLELQAQLEALH